MHYSKGKEKNRSVLISIAARTGTWVPKIRSFIGGVSTKWESIHLWFYMPLKITASRLNR